MKKRLNPTEPKPEKLPGRRESGAYQVGYGKPPVHSRWKKGQSGNPTGQNSLKLISQAYKHVIAQLDKKKKQSLALSVAWAVVLKAVDGDVRAAQEIADRTEGKPVQAVDMNASISAVRQLSDEDLAAAIQERIAQIATGAGRRTSRPS